MWYAAKILAKLHISSDDNNSRISSVCLYARTGRVTDTRNVCAQPEWLNFKFFSLSRSFTKV